MKITNKIQNLKSQLSSIFARCKMFIVNQIQKIKNIIFSNLFKLSLSFLVCQFSVQIISYSLQLSPATTTSTPRQFLIIAALAAFIAFFFIFFKSYQLIKKLAPKVKIVAVSLINSVITCALVQFKQVCPIMFNKGEHLKNSTYFENEYIFVIGYFLPFLVLIIYLFLFQQNLPQLDIFEDNIFASETKIAQLSLMMSHFFLNAYLIVMFEPPILLVTTLLLERVLEFQNTFYLLSTNVALIGVSDIPAMVFILKYHQINFVEQTIALKKHLATKLLPLSQFFIYQHIPSLFACICVIMQIMAIGFAFFFLANLIMESETFFKVIRYFIIYFFVFHILTVTILRVDLVILQILHDYQFIGISLLPSTLLELREQLQHNVDIKVQPKNASFFSKHFDFTKNDEFASNKVQQQIPATLRNILAKAKLQANEKYKKPALKKYFEKLSPYYIKIMYGASAEPNKPDLLLRILAQIVEHYTIPAIFITIQCISLTETYRIFLNLPKFVKKSIMFQLVQFFGFIFSVVLYQYGGLMPTNNYVFSEFAQYLLTDHVKYQQMHIPLINEKINSMQNTGFLQMVSTVQSPENTPLLNTIIIEPIPPHIYTDLVKDLLINSPEYFPTMQTKTNVDLWLNQQIQRKAAYTIYGFVTLFYTCIFFRYIIQEIRKKK